MNTPALEGGFMLPNDQLPLIPGGPWGGLGILGAALAGGFLWLRKFLSRDAVDRSSDDAYKSTIEMLSKQLDASNARADRERERANQLMTSLDGAMQQIGQLKNQVSELTGEVKRLQAKVAALSPRNPQ